MDARENSKELQQQQTFGKQEQYNIYPMNFNVLENTKGNTNRCNSVFFVPSEGYCDVPTHDQHSFENNSGSDSSSEVHGDASDDDASLDEVLHDGKAKNKIDLLAAMVGVDTKEPAVVLSEVVRVLKLLKRVNQYPININT